jgi:hypothetical protein
MKIRGRKKEIKRAYCKGKNRRGWSKGEQHLGADKEYPKRTKTKFSHMKS